MGFVGNYAPCGLAPHIDDMRLKLSPVVNGVAGYFLCIGGIRFDLTDCVVSVVFDQMRIDRTYKEAGFG